MPVQIKRLLIAFAIFIAIMLVLKHFLTPDSWKEYGHYRGHALVEIADSVARYVDQETCAYCHDTTSELKSQGMHVSVQCETCHGPGYLHVDDPEANLMVINKDNSLCLRCHLLNPARRQEIVKQIDPADHAEGEECISCHNPHQP